MRGKGGHWIFIDEAAFCDQEGIIVGILPMVTEKKCCLVGITTPNGEDNIITKLYSIKDENGEPLVNAVSLSKPCDQCIQEGKLCPHLDTAGVAGTSDEKRHRILKIFQAAGMDRQGLRELTGQMGDDSSSFFPQIVVNRLRERKHAPVEAYNVSMLFGCIDPAMTGANEFSFIISYFDERNGYMSIVLIDSYDLKNAGHIEIRGCIEGTINALRAAHPRFREVPLVLCVEAAPTAMAGTVADVCGELSEANDYTGMPILCMKQINNGQNYGVSKTNRVTEKMAYRAANWVARDAVVFSEVLTTSKEEKGFSPTKIALDQKAALLDQMLNYRKYLHPQKNIWRIDGKRSCTNDDLTVSFVMLFYYYKLFWTEPREDYEAIRTIALMNSSNSIFENPFGEIGANANGYSEASLLKTADKKSRAIGFKNPGTRKRKREESEDDEFGMF